MATRLVSLTLKGYTPAGYGLDILIEGVDWDKCNLALEGLERKAQDIGLKPVMSRNGTPTTKQALDVAAPTCPIHNVLMELHEKGSSRWYSHKVTEADGSDKWCRGK